jgi:hypothetical protein
MRDEVPDQDAERIVLRERVAGKERLPDDGRDGEE